MPTDRASSWASHLDVGLWRNVGLGIRPQYKQLNLNAFNRVIVPRVWALRVRYLWLIEPVANPPHPFTPAHTLRPCGVAQPLTKHVKLQTNWHVQLVE